MSSETELPDLPGGFDWRWEHSPTVNFITNIRGKMRKASATTHPVRVWSAKESVRVY